MTNEIVIMIVNEKLEPKVLDMLNYLEITGVARHKARGMSKHGFIEFLNLGHEDKTIYFSITSSIQAKELRQIVEEKELFKHARSGIMFSLKLGGTKMIKSEKCVVITVVDYGYSSTVMKLARENGATGGTIFDGRGTGANFSTFLGMDISSEKEIILNVVEKTYSKKITSAIKNHFKDENVSGICFTMPITNFVGINNK